MLGRTHPRSLAPVGPQNYGSITSNGKFLSRLGAKAGFEPAALQRPTKAQLEIYFGHIPQKQPLGLQSNRALHVPQTAWSNARSTCSGVSSFKRFR